MTLLCNLELMGPYPLPMSSCVDALFSMTVITKNGDGSNSLFWKDRWILG
jgi:hypothetical protein